jgi:cytochrome P450
VAVVAAPATPEPIEVATAAMDELLAYLGHLVARRSIDPGPDLVSALAAARAEGRSLSHDEVVDMVATLLVAGHDTTAGQLARTLHTLLRHPDQLDRLRDDRSLLAHAVAETIRYEPSISFVPCTTTEPLDLDRRLPAGSLLFLCRASANRDPAVWHRGDVFDVGRFADPDAPRLLDPGAGLHQCLGAALERLTIEEAIRAVLDLGRLDAIEDPDSVSWRAVLGPEPAPVNAEIASWRTPVAA